LSCWATLLLQLLLELEGSSLILEDSLVEVSLAILPLVVVHDYVTILSSDHLYILVLLLVHNHSRREIISHLVAAHGIVISFVCIEDGSMGNPLNHLALGRSLLFSLTLSKFLLALDRGPVDAISNWLATSAEDWERIEPWVSSEDLFPVFCGSDIVHTLERLA
jgi:hypothetical protein